MSDDLRWAKSARDNADAAIKAHDATCPPCSQTRYKRGARCEAGQGLLQVRWDAEYAVDRQRRQAAQDTADAAAAQPDLFGQDVVHQCPPGDGAAMPCCGRTPFEVPRLDRMTSKPDLVTCSGVVGGGS